jgi:PKD repeat protein
MGQRGILGIVSLVGLVAAPCIGLASCGLGSAPDGAPTADFVTHGSVGDAPLLVFFQDRSTGGVTSWTWDFGDGEGSSEPSPAHTYATPATYSVTLTVEGPDGSDTRMLPRAIRVFDGDLKGLWSSPRELVGLSTGGAAWAGLLQEADRPTGIPNVADQDDDVDVRVLAKAIVFVRTNDESYRQEVIAACMAAIDSELGGRTLALGRNLIGYVLAADLVGLPPFEDAHFRDWLERCRTETLDGDTLASTHERRPNNWGTHAGASRVAVAAYLGDTAELERCARVLRGWLGDRSAYAGFEYGALDWQADPARPVGINPAGARRDGHSIDGVLPDDQRRSGAFVWPPPRENYVWEALQGALAQALILTRAGHDAFGWSDQALLRAVTWLHEQCDYPASGDDTWQPHLVNYAYAASFPAPVPSSPGKNVGWTDWTLQ